MVSLCLAGYLVFSFLHRQEACSVLASSAGRWVLNKRDTGCLFRSAPRQVSGRALCLSVAWLLPPRVKPPRTACGQVHAGTRSTDKGNFLVLCFRPRPFSMTMLSLQHFRAALGAVVSPRTAMPGFLGVGHRAWDWPEALRRGGPLGDPPVTGPSCSSRRDDDSRGGFSASCPDTLRVKGR